MFEVRFTLWFLGISTVVIVGTTSLWSLHNQRIFDRKGARTGHKVVAEDHSRDVLGRPVDYPSSQEECLTASVVIVRLEEGRKVYHPALLGGRSARESGA